MTDWYREDHFPSDSSFGSSETLTTLNIQNPRAEHEASSRTGHHQDYQVWVDLLYWWLCEDLLYWWLCEVLIQFMKQMLFRRGGPLRGRRFESGAADSRPLRQGREEHSHQGRHEAGATARVPKRQTVRETAGAEENGKPLPHHTLSLFWIDWFGLKWRNVLFVTKFKILYQYFNKYSIRLWVLWNIVFF